MKNSRRRIVEHFNRLNPHNAVHRSSTRARTVSRRSPVETQETPHFCKTLELIDEGGEERLQETTSGAHATEDHHGPPEHDPVPPDIDQHSGSVHNEGQNEEQAVSNRRYPTRCRQSPNYFGQCETHS